MRRFNGRDYLLEEAIKADYAFVHVWKADKLGNCVFRYAAQNFSGVMARNAKLTIVEAEHIVEPGEIDPGQVHLPGILCVSLWLSLTDMNARCSCVYFLYFIWSNSVDRIVPATAEKRIENIVLKSHSDSTSDSTAPMDDKKALAARKRELIVRRAAKELKDGMYVNLGIGMPMLAPAFLEPGTQVYMQSENGIIGLLICSLAHP